LRIFTRSASKNTSGFGALPRSRLQRPGLPGGDLVQHGIRDRADQVGRNLDAVQLQHMPGDLAGAEAAGIERHDLLVEAGEAALVFGDQLRVEAALPIARHLEPDPPTGVGQHRLAAIAAAAVPGARLAAEMVVHLGIQRPLGERLLQLIEQAALLQGSGGIRAGEQLVQQLIGDVRCFPSSHGGGPSFPS
jgi:hypothetical protein